MSTVLFVNTRPTRSEAEPPFWAARRLGLDVVVLADVTPPVPAGLVAELVMVDTFDLPALRAAARAVAERHEVVGVVCWGDRDVEGVAHVAEELGLPGNAPEAAARARDKHAARQAIAAVDASLVPPFAAIRSVADVDAAARAVPFPAVVKPVGASASKGILTVRDRVELDAAVALLLRYSTPENDPVFRRRAGELVLEGFLRGTEHSVDGIVVDGRLELWTVTDKLVDPGYHLELQQVQPSALPPEVLERCRSAAQTVADALGLGTTAIHLEVMVDGVDVRVIELNSRTAGGYITTHLIPLSRGSDFVTEVLAAACRLRAVEPAREATLHVGSRQHLTTRTGHLHGVGGLDAVLGVPGVVGAFMDGPLGRPVGQPPEDFTGSVICSVLAAAGSRDELERILREADALIRVDVR
ncbi:ATP-grasp domain-containing protein [Clavibacter tessellarius]|uniref:ATP-grasp domain-containing protein n=1 Tax=Clavibacter tessellarius TaxID=31965 RepID=A0A154V322_9MICO|nr:ATP-grasp domain-containing protein [Clavibacter michiganensis]KZC95649.1 hypothetical protein AWH51_06205 [Clavibacter michiganensis subsp. tessellarius]